MTLSATTSKTLLKTEILKRKKKKELFNVCYAKYGYFVNTNQLTGFFIGGAEICFKPFWILNEFFLKANARFFFYYYYNSALYFCIYSTLPSTQETYLGT